MRNPVAIAVDAEAPAREPRLVLRVLEIWRQACGEDEIPAAGSLTAADTGADAEHIFMIDLLHPTGPRFSHIGTAVRGSFWPPEREPLVADCPVDSVLGQVTQHWREIVDRRVAITRGGPGINEGTQVLYRGIMMPLADENGRISHIMGAVNWRPVEESYGAPSE